MYGVTMVTSSSYQVVSMFLDRTLEPLYPNHHLYILSLECRYTQSKDHISPVIILYLMCEPIVVFKARFILNDKSVDIMRYKSPF